MPYVVRRTPDSVETWASERLPFQPTGWKRQWRDELAGQLRHVEPGAALDAVYTSPDLVAADVENVLLYNVGATPFTGLTRAGLRLERVVSEPPPTHEALDWIPRHHHRYHIHAIDEWFRHWRLDRLLGSWHEVAMPQLTSPLLTPSLVWATVSAPCVPQLGDVPRRFGLRLRLRGTGGRPVSNMVKPVLDGVISAFHSYAGAPPTAVVERVARAAGLAPEEVHQRLLSPAHAVLGERVLVRLTASGVAWNPADDGVVACSITAEPDGSPSMSGELFSVADPLSLDVKMTSLEPPAQRWSDEDWEQLRIGTSPRDMDDRWWIVVSGNLMRVHRAWTGALIFEAVWQRGNTDWGIERAWVTASATSTADTELLGHLIKRECLHR